MALEEEFEYLAFRCAFCATFNPARKQRPIAPALSSDESKEESKSEGSDDENTDDCKPLEGIVFLTSSRNLFWFVCTSLIISSK